MKSLILLSVLALANCGAAKIQTAVESEKLGLTNSATEETPQEKRLMDKETLAKRIEPTDANTARIVRDAASQIELLNAPFLQHGSIYRVSKFAPTRPIQLYIGCDDKQFCAVLNANAENFQQLIEKAGLTLKRRELRLAFAQAFLQIVCSPVNRLQILSDIKSLTARPALDAEGKQRFEEILTKYEKTIVAPTTTDESPFLCTFFAVKNQDLVKLELTLQPNGAVQVKEIVLEKNLPIAYAM